VSIPKEIPLPDGKKVDPTQIKRVIFFAKQPLLLVVEEGNSYLRFFEPDFSGQTLVDYANMLETILEPGLDYQVHRVPKNA
jgi:hypothetical protein